MVKYVTIRCNILHAVWNREQKTSTSTYSYTVLVLCIEYYDYKVSVRDAGHAQFAFAKNEGVRRDHASACSAHQLRSQLKLSPVVCKKLTTAVSNFWWGSSLDNHKIHWLRWEK